jgi:glycosyltransferase involved in cell wall biosynthesis
VRDVLLVDPSLFTAPYDAALSRGLMANDVQPRWATRALRKGEEAVIDISQHLSLFYRWTDGPNRREGSGIRVLKGIEHAAALRQLVRMAEAVDLVHFQWTLLPKLDVRAIRAIRRHCPVVLTVHDTTPYNGKSVSALQTAGLQAVFDAVDRLIVHSPGAQKALVEAGVPRNRIEVVPHGLLPLPSACQKTRNDGRWQIVQFGKIQHYKGVDLLIEALGHLDKQSRSQLRVIVAGEPHINMEPLFARARALDLGDVLIFRPSRHSEAEMANLLGNADAFIFPYRAIEASGVLSLVAGAGKWLIASDLGTFTDTIGRDETAGSLVAPNNPVALAEAMMASIGRKPARSIASGVPDWTEIGRMTNDVYDTAIADWRTELNRTRKRIAA